MQPKSGPPALAAGYMLFRRAPSLGWLLLRNARHGTWGFPKGHAEGNESELETASREAREETGIERVDLVEGFRTTIQYPYVRQGQARMKRVVYFLAEAPPGSEPIVSDEHDAAGWASAQSAMGRLGFANLRSAFAPAVARAWRFTGWKPDLPPREDLRWCIAGNSAPGLDAAREILFSLGSLDDGWIAHSTAVASAARTVAEVLAAAGQATRPAFVEAAGTLHDVGRALDHERHGRAGFELLKALDLPEMARICAVHWLKGRTPSQLLSDGFQGGHDDLELASRLAAAPLTLEEEVVVLADSVVSGREVVGVEERNRRAVERYGDTPWMRRNLENSLVLREKIESLAGMTLEAMTGGK